MLLNVSTPPSPSLAVPVARLTVTPRGSDHIRDNVADRQSVRNRAAINEITSARPVESLGTLVICRTDQAVVKRAAAHSPIEMSVSEPPQPSLADLAPRSTQDTRRRESVCDQRRCRHRRPGCHCSRILRKCRLRSRSSSSFDPAVPKSVSDALDPMAFSMPVNTSVAP